MSFEWWWNQSSRRIPNRSCMPLTTWTRYQRPNQTMEPTASSRYKLLFLSFNSYPLLPCAFSLATAQLVLVRRMARTIEGGCLCGGVRYRLHVRPKQGSDCHCED